MANHPVPEPKSSILQGKSVGTESDLGELAAMFAAHGGGNFSLEVSAQLALEIVLNEIVEQACLATGATGAAIVLVRDGEMVCRASSGANAPVLGAPLGSESGLTAECIRTQQVQRCDDAQADPRADAEASRRLGVRSVMILPLLRKGELAGVLEVFSSRPGAFGDRDELTLEALADRILKNLERASEPLSLSSRATSSSSDAAPGDGAQNPPAARVAPVVPISQAVPEESRAGSGSEKSVWEEADVLRKIAGRRARPGFDGMSLALGAAVLICAVLLGALVGVRMGWRRATTMRGQVAKPASGAGVSGRNSTRSIPTQSTTARDTASQNGAAQASGEAGANAASTPAGSVSGSGGVAGSEKKNAPAAEGTSAAKAKNSVLPPGSLLVYENGKEIFRLLPTAEGEPTDTNETGARGAAPGEVQQASAAEPAGTVEVAPDVAEGSLLHRVEPEYPEEARQQRIQGAVVLEVRIGRDGAIQDVKLVSGQPSLANAAIAAVKQWQFKPRMVQGQPVEMQTRITLNFRLPR
jgi:TonB family protein